MPFAASAYLARQLLLPRALGVVTTLPGTDITVVGMEPAFFRITQFSIQSSDRVTAVSRFLKERAEETFGITRPIEVVYNFVDASVFAPRRRSLPRSRGRSRHPNRRRADRSPRRANRANRSPRLAGYVSRQQRRWGREDDRWTGLGRAR